MKETYEEILNNSTKIIINIGKLKLKLKLLIESKLYKSLYFFKINGIRQKKSLQNSTEFFQIIKKKTSKS